MNEDMVKLGKLIKATREERNLTLKDIANATSIRESYLNALEMGKIYDCISPVYGQGFLRQYLQFLNMKLEVLMENYPQAFRQPKEKQEFDYGMGTLEMRGSDRGHSKLIPNILWGVFGTIIILSAWLLVKYLGLL
jgi:cytoskeletal protein RodZ